MGSGVTLTVRIPGRPPGGNALHRMGHWAVRKSREEWRDITYLSAAQALAEARIAGTPWTVPKVAQVAAEWHFRTRRRRDYDNLVSGLKPLLDGLVQAGVILDDSTEYLATLGPFSVQVSGVDETVLTVSVA